MSLPAKLLYVTRRERVLRHVLSRSYEQGQVTLCPIGMERWNWYEDTDPSQPRADGSFDVEGHCWADVAIRHRTRWWSLMDWYVLLSRAFYFLRHRVKPDWFLPRYFYFSPFTVTSFLVKKGEIAEDIAFERLGDPPKDDRHFIDRMTNRSPEYKAYIDDVIRVSEEVRGKLSSEDVEAKLASEGYVEIIDGIWLKLSDWTTICVNESVWPFGLRDGWTDRELCALIGQVLDEHAGVRAEIVTGKYGEQ